MYQQRCYRNLIRRPNLASFRVAVKETDLCVQTVKPLEALTKELILRYRAYLEAYIQKYPVFAATLRPYHIRGPAPQIVREMAEAGQAAGVGPMAAVAGAMAEQVGKDLLAHSAEVIVENGGDVYLKTDTPATIAIFGGKSPLSMRIGLRIDPAGKSVAVCTSSGTVGHSLSLGKADAVCVVSGSCALADAAATAIGNRIKTQSDINPAIEFGKRIAGITGIVVLVSDKLGLWGQLEMVKL